MDYGETRKVIMSAKPPRKGGCHNAMMTYLFFVFCSLFVVLFFCYLFWMYFFFGNHPKKKYQKERSPLLMHLLKSTASSIRAGRAAQHNVNGWFQYTFCCARGLLADVSSFEDALILNADPSNAEEEWQHVSWRRPDLAGLHDYPPINL